jgi:hypothetical protein
MRLISDTVDFCDPEEVRVDGIWGAARIIETPG